MTSILLCIQIVKFATIPGLGGKPSSAQLRLNTSQLQRLLHADNKGTEQLQAEIIPPKC